MSAAVSSGKRIRAAAVYLASGMPKAAVYLEAARDLGEYLAANDIALVYGGSNIGLMKVVADTVLEHGGSVTGIFTENLPGDLMYRGLTETVVVKTLAERKEEMLRRSDAVAALPGSFGTWDELFDALALRKIHSPGGLRRPVGVLNVNGYFDPLFELIRNSVTAGFTQRKYADLLVSGKTPEELFRKLSAEII